MKLNDFIDAQLEIESKATKGPWDHEHGRGISLPSREHCVRTIHNHGTSSWSRDIAVAAHANAYNQQSDNWANMELIASARNNYRPLLLALKEAIAALDTIHNESLGGDETTHALNDYHLSGDALEQIEALLLAQQKGEK